jgi:tRNA(Met) C34 N-acetyltransferase TmcA
VPFEGTPDAEAAARSQAQAVAAAARAAAAAGGLGAEAVAPTSAAALPPLLRRLSEVRAPALDYIGVAFGLSYELLQFWRKVGYAPVYLRQQPNDTTGEHSLLMLTVRTAQGCVLLPSVCVCVSLCLSVSVCVCVCVCVSL